VDQNWLVSVCHAGTEDRAESVCAQLAAAFPQTETEVLTLSPALTTHGGPGCIVVQAIKK
jgi:fatty acid-binding protein DegV